MGDTKEAARQLKTAASALAKVADLAPAGKATREEAERCLARALGAHRQLFGSRPRAKKGEGAGPRLLAYFKANAGEWLAGEELRAAAGFIDNWARRVRELRVELGYDISEKGDMYRLESVMPDKARAERWQS